MLTVKLEEGRAMRMSGAGVLITTLMKRHEQFKEQLNVRGDEATRGPCLRCEHIRRYNALFRQTIEGPFGYWKGEP